MDNLLLAAEFVETAAHETDFANRQNLFEIGLAGIEIDKGDLACFILADDTVRNAVAPARRHEMLKNPYFECHDRTGQGTGHLRPVAPVNGARRPIPLRAVSGAK